MSARWAWRSVNRREEDGLARGYLVDAKILLIMNLAIQFKNRITRDILQRAASKVLSHPSLQLKKKMLRTWWSTMECMLNEGKFELLEGRICMWEAAGAVFFMGESLGWMGLNTCTWYMQKVLITNLAHAKSMRYMRLIKMWCVCIMIYVVGVDKCALLGGQTYAWNAGAQFFTDENLWICTPSGTNNFRLYPTNGAQMISSERKSTSLWQHLQKHCIRSFVLKVTLPTEGCSRKL